MPTRAVDVVGEAQFYTPWGRTPHLTHYEPGLMHALGEGGAGFIVTEGFAKRRFSGAARTRGVRYGRYLAYAERTHHHLIVAWELRPLEFLDVDPAHVHLDLSRHHPDYLRSVGGVPEPKAERLWEIEHSFQRRVMARDPDVIVQAQRVCGGRVEVTMADMTRHLVTEQSFDDLWDDRLPLLSRCVVVNAPSI